MSFSIGKDVVISDSTIDPGTDKDGQPRDVKVGDGTTISGSAIGNGATK
ncbi:hypothetical protein [Nocardiopsis ganjiahuensis]|nr:hypothetical protein [Nocardiopsis ganjiahuensis]